MALSNMKKEPRREWTEQFFGLLGVGFWFGLSIRLAMYIDPWHVIKDAPPWWLQIVGISLLVGLGLLLSLFLLAGLWFIAHDIGETICDIMRDMGIDPRPPCRTTRWGWDK